MDFLAVAPGNAQSTATVAEQHDVDATSPQDVTDLARRLAVDLVVIGPEVPLVRGVADGLRAGGDRLFRTVPGRRPHRGVESLRQGRDGRGGRAYRGQRDGDTPARLDAALDRFGPPAGQQAWVVKDDGLAAGKGVVVTADRDVARAHAAGLLDGGHPVLLESFLDGPEVSLFCLVDGATVVPLLAGPGLQAGGRQRRRAQHRRDGRLRPVAVAARRADRPDRP